MSTDTLTKSRWVYSFGGGSADGDASMKNLLGGKGANLAEMSSLGLPVPSRVIHGDSFTAALALVAQTDVVGFFVEPLADYAFKRVGIRRVELDDPLPVMQMCVIQRHGSRLTPAALQFIECVKEVLGVRQPPTPQPHHP